eukprot:714502-Rhodomonas_salina.1
MRAEKTPFQSTLYQATAVSGVHVVYSQRGRGGGRGGGGGGRRWLGRVDEALDDVTVSSILRMYVCISCIFVLRTRIACKRVSHARTNVLTQGTARAHCKFMECELMKCELESVDCEFIEYQFMECELTERESMEC